MNKIVQPRARAQAIAAGKGDGYTLAVPLALRLAARIQERPLENFFADATQLANGLNEFFQAVSPDGIIVTDPEVLAEDVKSESVATLTDATHFSTAIEAANRLRSTVGDGAALTAVLPGPGDIAALRNGDADVGEITQAMVNAFLGVGVDIILFRDDGKTDSSSYTKVLKTCANMARFHRSLVRIFGGQTSVLGELNVLPIDSPHPQSGLVITDEELPTDTSLTLVEEWIDIVRD